MKGPEVLQQGWDRSKTVFQKCVLAMFQEVLLLPRILKGLASLLACSAVIVLLGYEGGNGGS